MKLYQKIARLIACINSSPVSEMFDTWEMRLREIERSVLPSGSGFDAGCKIQDNSTSNKIVISCDYHHINGCGYYDGWSEHTVIVTPCLQFGFSMRVTGRNRNMIKDYISDTFHELLNNEVKE